MIIELPNHAFSFQLIVSIGLFLISIGSMALIHRFWKLPNPRNVKYQSIEGLRGFLALGVVVHHFWIWVDFCKSGQWGKFQSGFTFEIGNTSVLFFFVITGFLFVEKILTTTTEFNYWGFILNRFKRLAPAYYFSGLLVSFIVFYQQHWELKVNVSELVNAVSYLLTFGLFGSSEINLFQETVLINAGVVWTLKYEWLFYFGLPLAKVFSKNVLSFAVSICAALFLNGLLLWKGNGPWDVYYLRYFIIGGTTAIVLKNDAMNKIMKGTVWEFLLIFGIGLLYLDLFPHHFLRDIFILILFTLIVVGNSSFGILTSNGLMLLGRISYSIYVLHGILYFIAYQIIIGCQLLNSLHIWVKVVFGMVLMPILIVLSTFSYTFIEASFMKTGKNA